MTADAVNAHGHHDRIIMPETAETRIQETRGTQETDATTASMRLIDLKNPVAMQTDLHPTEMTIVVTIATIIANLDVQTTMMKCIMCIAAPASFSGNFTPHPQHPMTRTTKSKMWMAVRLNEIKMRHLPTCKTMKKH